MMKSLSKPLTCERKLGGKFSPNYFLNGGCMKILLMVLAICASAYLSRGEADDEAVRYCDMTSIWQSTNGAAGWPPYRGKCEVAHE